MNDSSCLDWKLLNQKNLEEQKKAKQRDWEGKATDAHIRGGFTPWNVGWRKDLKSKSIISASPVPSRGN
ncbi:hypothetical protein CEXT_112491 [Caerostris extrusa]|uniref:Uncharacterized protein n=1 Tax=Caerostris extrusa TaxID=172846 RepID=A0AAV4W4C4_CAEEX|nr:hypothetical protein CEXT_112491 [Caerostris extrusa]